MAKRSKRVRALPKAIKGFKMPSREELYRNMEEVKEQDEKRKRKEKRDLHRAFIQSGVQVGFSVRQVLGLRRNFSSDHRKHWDCRVGG